MNARAGEKALTREALGETLEDRFELGPQVSTAGATEIVAAKDRHLGRGVAVKRPTPEATEPDIKRVMIEAQIAAQLEHAHVVPLYSMEIGHDGQPAFTMKRVRGETLSQYIDRCVEAGDPREGPYSLRRRVEHFLDVCEAVSFAHERGVYHRNLSLDTVTIDAFGEVYVTDWGSARRGDAALAGAELLISPPPLSEPPVSFDVREKTRDEAAEGKDRHALALLLSELVSLAPRAPADPASAPVPRSRRRVPPALAAILRAALVDGHYSTVRALADDLHKLTRGEAPSVREDPWTTRLGKRIARRPVPYLTAVLAATLAIGSGAIAGRLRTLRTEAAEATRSRQLSQLTATLSDRADLLDGLLHDAAGELTGVRAMLEASPPAAGNAQIDGLLAGLARRTNALRAYATIDGVVHAIGPAVPDLGRRAPGPLWGQPLRRGPQEPWIVPLTLALRPPLSGNIGLDVPLALLTNAVSGHESARARGIRIVDHQGRSLDAQGPMPGAIDPELMAHIDRGAESDVIMRADRAIALARIHSLGWYVVGEKEIP